MAGRIVAPLKASVSMFLMWMRLIGVSRGTKIRRLRSFRQTSATRGMRASELPDAMEARVRMLQGAMTIESNTNDPEERGEVISSFAYSLYASLASLAFGMPSSRERISSPLGETIKCTSLPRSCRAFTSSYP